MNLKGSFVCKAIVFCALSFAATSAAFAQTGSPATGLGQSWPNATDVSRSPHWHVYTFVLNGITYVQVNDLNGTVHAAIGMANGSAITLPMGVDAQNVTTTPNPATNAQTETVYSSPTATVMATRQANGSTSFALLEECTDPYNCSLVAAPAR
jgi:hypothetical protein